MKRWEYSPATFFEKLTIEVAKDLLGKYLVRRINGAEIRVIITEVEAYDGFKDRASHASRGKTKRNEPMFGPAGYWYVYLCYGIHWMLNIVTGPKDYPAAVLIRGVITENGKKIDGPAKLTKFLKINKSFNGKKAGKKTGLWIATPSRKERRLYKGEPSLAQAGALLPKKFGAGRPKINRGPRIGVDYAGPVWTRKHYRFWIDTQ